MTALCTLRGVSKRYPAAEEVVALDDVNLDIDEGDFIAIEGPSGSGKSTLLNVLGLLDRPSEGSYQVAGTEVGSLTGKGLARVRAETIGFVFQQFHLVPRLPVIDNVAMGASYRGISRRERYNLALAALEELGMVHRAAAPSETLSGGERQRVAIARAVVGNRRLLLCDEPTGNLDSSNTANLLAILEERHESGSTVVVVTHDSSVAAVAQRRCVISDGRLVET